MLFFGWGSSRKQWHLGNGYYLLCTYDYAHFMFILRLTTNKKWFIIGNNRADDRQLTSDDLNALFPNGVPIVNAYYSPRELPEYSDHLD